MESDRRYHQLKAYLDGGMDRAERAAFEELLNESPDIQQEMGVV